MNDTDRLRAGARTLAGVAGVSACEVVDDTVFVVLEPTPLDEARAAASESAWAMIFDGAVRGAAPAVDPLLHFGTWKSSLTGALFSEDEMRNVTTTTAARIRGLAPRRILEIGASTGLLLFQLAPSCERYVGVDVSAEALASIAERLPCLGEAAGRVTLLRRSALQLADLDAGLFDCVVLDSVVQYFPSAAYLEEVVRRAVRLVAPGGHIFLGDLRSRPLASAHAALVEAHRLAEGDTLERVRARWERACTKGRELLVDPSFATALRQRARELTAAQVFLKGGASANELSGFRFDALFRVGGPALSSGDHDGAIFWHPWRGRAALAAALADPGATSLAVQGIPNARLTEALAARDVLMSSTPATTSAASPMDPPQLAALARMHGWDVHLGWTGDGDRGDIAALFTRAGPGATGHAASPKAATAWCGRVDLATRLRALRASSICLGWLT